MNQPAIVCSIPKPAVARLIRNFQMFLKTMGEACTSAAANNAATAPWSRAEQVLQREFVAVQAAEMAHSTGDSTLIVKHAANLSMLARRMDGYPLDFAGPDFEEQLSTQRRLLVLIAWQIHAAGNGSGSAGL